MMVLVQSSFHTNVCSEKKYTKRSSTVLTWASLFELEPNLLDWNVNELERQLELDDIKRTSVGLKRLYWSIWIWIWNSFWIKNC